MVRLLLLIILFPVIAGGTQVPELNDYVNDYAEILSDQEEADISAVCADLQDATDVHLVVLTVESLNGNSIEQFSIEVAEAWGVGNRERDDGLIILVAKEERRVRIEVGYGLEGDITDVASAYIIDRQMVPAFKDGEYGAGLLQGVESLSELARGADLEDLKPTYEPPPYRLSESQMRNILSFLTLVWILMLVFLRKAKWLVLGTVLMLGALALLFRTNNINSDDGRTILSFLGLSWFVGRVILPGLSGSGSGSSGSSSSYSSLSSRSTRSSGRRSSSRSGSSSRRSYSGGRGGRFGGGGASGSW